MAFWPKFSLVLWNLSLSHSLLLLLWCHRSSSSSFFFLFSSFAYWLLASTWLLAAFYPAVSPTRRVCVCGNNNQERKRTTWPDWRLQLEKDFDRRPARLIFSTISSTTKEEEEEEKRLRGNRIVERVIPPLFLFTVCLSPGESLKKKFEMANIMDIPPCYDCFWGLLIVFFPYPTVKKIRGWLHKC